MVERDFPTPQAVDAPIGDQPVLRPRFKTLMARAWARFPVARLFNLLTPKDSGVRRIASSVAYGPHPRQGYDVYGPKGASRALPMVVFVYGGGWYDGDRRDYSFMGYALAALGYVVVVPDYRLVPEVTYPAFVEDTAAAIRHAVTQAEAFGADADRLALMGHSSGAYDVVQAVLDPRHLEGLAVRCVIGMAGPYDFYPFRVDAAINAFGTWPNPEETQPARIARTLRTRFLLMHSLIDTVVYPVNARSLGAALEGAGTEVTLRTFESLSHADFAAHLSVPFRGRSTLRAEVAEFLEASLY